MLNTPERGLIPASCVMQNLRCRVVAEFERGPNRVATIYPSNSNSDNPFACSLPQPRMLCPLKEPFPPPPVQTTGIVRCARDAGPSDGLCERAKPARLSEDRSQFWCGRRAHINMFF